MSLKNQIKEERIGQGKDNVRGFLKENPEMAADIDQRLRAELLPKPKSGKPIDSDATDSDPQVEPEMVEIP